LEVLQLCPLSPYLEEGLRKHFELHRWFEIGDQEAWLQAHAGGIRAVATGGHLGIPSSLLLRLPALALVAINGVGYDKVDLQQTRARGVQVSHTPDVLTDDVADLALGLIIGLLRGIPAGHRHVTEGRWSAGPLPLGRKVSARRFGIIGMGRIGKAIAARLAVIAPVAYYDRTRKSSAYPYYDTPLELARDSDVLVLAASANPATLGMVDGALLDALGPQGYLINVARGSLVDEPALIDALSEGRIAGAALDVFAHEPAVAERLRSLPNVLLTPHIGSATIETRQNMARLVLESLQALAAGHPIPHLVPQ
jgi:lactate dehydrogenase-like 2-hydroxyacid dehydrogenase